MTGKAIFSLQVIIWHYPTFKLCFQFRHAKYFYWEFLLLKTMSHFNGKDWLGIGEGLDRHLHFQLLALFLSLIIKCSNKLFFHAMSFWLNSCMSHIVSIIGWKMSVVGEVRTCYQTSTKKIFFNKEIFPIIHHQFPLY